MNIFGKMRVLHRAWRYRLRSERDEVSYLLRQHLAGGTLVDIGANRGIYSYWMHRIAGPNGSVIAFEPQPELATYLGEVKIAFRLNNLTIVNVGLSSAEGTRILTRPKHHWGGGSIQQVRRPANMKMESFQVPVMTLDNFFRSNGKRPVRFIKCDVEGHEYDVFRGGQQLLSEDRPDLLFECVDGRARNGTVFRFLEGLGYRGFFFFNGRLRPIAEYAQLRPSIRKLYLNYVFRASEY